MLAFFAVDPTVAAAVAITMSQQNCMERDEVFSPTLVYVTEQTTFRTTKIGHGQFDGAPVDWGSAYCLIHRLRAAFFFNRWQTECNLNNLEVNLSLSIVHWIRFFIRLLQFCLFVEPIFSRYHDYSIIRLTFFFIPMIKGVHIFCDKTISRKHELLICMEIALIERYSNCSDEGYHAAYTIFCLMILIA